LALSMISWKASLQLFLDQWQENAVYYLIWKQSSIVLNVI